MTKITLSQIEQYLSKAVQILNSSTGTLKDLNTYIFPMLFFKRISDIYNEEYQNNLLEYCDDEKYDVLPEFHHFVIPQGCHWDNVRDTATNIGLKIEQCLREIEVANQHYLHDIFGDVQWSNKEKLPDRLLTDLIEHFSQYTLSRSHVAPDMLGQSYEYLIKYFATQNNIKSGNGEFYTPRSVVHLLGLIIDPKEQESIYDPACGTGGILIESIEHLKKSGEDYRTLRFYGQEKNLTSFSIARMNMFLHGVKNFQIAQGDTLHAPAFFDVDGLKTFNCVIANPPFSLKNWGADEWANDPYRRNITGVPPKGNGDMAWVQHMIKSMKPDSGRMAVVLPHGVLFRKGVEGKIRKILLEQDLLEAIIGIGKNLFYATKIATCIMVFRSLKPDSIRNKVCFIDASDQIRIGRAQNFLGKEHIDQIYHWYQMKRDVENYVKMATMEEIAKNDYNLNISLYVEKIIKDDLPTMEEALIDLKQTWKDCQQAEKTLILKLREFGVEI